MNRRLLGGFVLTALVGSLTLLSGGAAAAEGETNIDHVEVADDGTVSVLLALDGLPPGAVPDPDSLEVSVDGGLVTANAEEVADSTISRTAVLVLDASLSMRGDRIAAAQEAAKAYIAAAAPDLRIGLLTFAGEVISSTEPTTDRDALIAAVDGISLADGTNLYDAVVAGVDLAGTDGARSVLVLSDGRDRGQGATVAEATEAATEAGVVVDAVSLSDKPGDRELLSEIAVANGGRVVPADPAALTQAFKDQADAFAQQWVVTFDQPTGTGGDADLEVSVTADGTTYADSALVALPSAEERLSAVEPGKAGLGTPALVAGAAALTVSIAVLVWFALGGALRGPTLAQQQIAYFSGESGPGRPGDVAQRGSLRDSAVAATERLIDGDIEAKLLLRLQGGGVKLTAAEWLLLHAGIAVGSAFVGFVLDGPLLGILLLLAGAAVPWMWLQWKHNRRRAAFHEQLPPTLQLLAGGMSAGLSMPQAVDGVVQEGAEPMRGELRRALSESRLGVELPDALDGVAHRMDSQDFGWVVMAIRIQREVGGNLAELLNTVADTLREREQLRGLVRVLSAEGRISAWVLGALPPLMFLYLLFVRPDFVRPLYTTLPGLAILAAAVGLLVAGFFALSRLIRIEV